MFKKIQCKIEVMCKEYKIVGSDLVDLKVNQIQLLETIYIPINKKFSFEMK